MTAPTPERRVGEAKRPRIEADRVEELADGKGIWIDALPDGIAPGIGNEPWDSREAHDLALDLLDERAAVARLTAEVERVRGMVKEAYEEGRVSHDYKWEDSNTFYDLEHPAALSLPTPAPEATDG